MVSVSFQDLEALRREARFGANWAYTGKQVIHPNRSRPVQEALHATRRRSKSPSGWLESLRDAAGPGRWRVCAGRKD